ncbi:MAG: HAMP domain-containing protein [Chloroflexi bacterium]|nr:HAMP domain-containing protein [Chloroflexota bacterium]
MKGVPESLFVAPATVLGLVSVVLVVAAFLLDPPAGDLVALATFLALSGGTTAVGLAVARLGLPRWSVSLRSRLVVISVVTAVLALVNVGFTASLMFLSTHDLGLLAGLLAFSVGISIYVAFAIAEPTARSVRELADAAQRISEGSLDARVSVQSLDEIGRLASAFNTMAERLQAGFARERELDRARKELISAVSHDLRTPLAAVDRQR